MLSYFYKFEPDIGQGDIFYEDVAQLFDCFWILVGHLNAVIEKDESQTYHSYWGFYSCHWNIFS